ncbi:MAG: hypothetical protein QOH56_856 [Pseudonocardiales bacterium]|jgi:hypothetical protein|nr:hypothetical protein [Pseudonocardiales bacterium]
MTFRDYYDLPDTRLALPIGGSTYVLPPPPFGEDRKRLVAALDGQKPMADGEFLKLVLGSALDEMRTAGVPGEVVSMAALTAVADLQHGRVVAEIFWETRGEKANVPAYIAGLDETSGAKPSVKSVRKAPAKRVRPNKAVSRTSAGK